MNKFLHSKTLFIPLEQNLVLASKTPKCSRGEEYRITCFKIFVFINDTIIFPSFKLTQYIFKSFFSSSSTAAHSGNNCVNNRHWDLEQLVFCMHGSLPTYRINETDYSCLGERKISQGTIDKN